jgi:hypothetical protein
MLLSFSFYYEGKGQPFIFHLHYIAEGYDHNLHQLIDFSIDSHYGKGLKYDVRIQVLYGYILL